MNIEWWPVEELSEEFKRTLKTDTMWWVTILWKRGDGWEPLTELAHYDFGHFASISGEHGWESIEAIAPAEDSIPEPYGAHRSKAKSIVDEFFDGLGEALKPMGVR